MITAIEVKKRADDIRHIIETVSSIEKDICIAAEQGLYQISLSQIDGYVDKKTQAMIFDYIRDHGFAVIESPEEVIVDWSNVEEQKGEYHDGTE